ncbi:hypothetical protein KGQ25_00390 [Patescibacteria group bacterium]|nr:hypothetical protein [Patescibacteria group bacterium]MDE2173146.1 hypothetical protein [Patescibacteria group bacterium]
MLRIAFWIFILFLALSFFGISIQEIVNSPTGQENLHYLSYLFVTGLYWLNGYFRHVLGFFGK